ncbi:MAG: hypothetical protein PVG66_11510 [Chromatiales bacterium]
MSTIAVLLALFWLLVIFALWLYKSKLLKKTWSEPYFKEAIVLIESDDWGPGGDFHAERLKRVGDVLSATTDSNGRPAVMTGNMVLRVPDLFRSSHNPENGLISRSLLEDFPQLLEAFQHEMSRGVFVPQLHGLEHLHSDGLWQLTQSQDARIEQAASTENWWDWETLDSPLQGHYVDGTSLPTKAHPADTQFDLVQQATRLFTDTFGFHSQSTVAPCYLWVDDTEIAWAQQNIEVIQTAGYRCPGRRADASYIQDMPETRPGHRNQRGQIYLVRNAMYEPVDGRGADECIKQIDHAVLQASPASISTHRYNFTRSEQECQDSLTGLQQILQHCKQHYPNLRFVSSPELGLWLLHGGELENPANKSRWPGLHLRQGWQKLAPFLYRLWYRHKKIRQIASFSGLIVPAWLMARLTRP